MSEVDKLVNARCRLITKEPFYGHITMSIEWKEHGFPNIDDDNAKSIGFRINSVGEIQALYYPEWAERHSLKHIYGTIEHAINHLIRLHTVRCGSRIKQAWGIATDMAVNGNKQNPHIGYREDDGSIVLPDEKMIFVPKSWEDNQTAEWYYEKIMSEAGQGKNKDGQPDPNVECGNCKENEFQYGQFEGVSLDDHEVWQQSEISQDDARQIVSDMVKDAASKSQGHVPGHLIDAVEALNKPIVRWREILRRYLGTHVGNRRRTWSRRDRRFSKQFGKKGTSHHAASTVVVLVDRIRKCLFKFGM